MKRQIVILAAFASLLSSGTASKARPVWVNEYWCLNVKEDRGGGRYVCSFATYEQCMASRTANGEWCMLNPELRAAPRIYTYDYR